MYRPRSLDRPCLRLVLARAAIAPLATIALESRRMPERTPHERSLLSLESVFDNVLKSASLLCTCCCLNTDGDNRVRSWRQVTNTRAHYSRADSRSPLLWFRRFTEPTPYASPMLGGRLLVLVRTLLQAAM